MKTCNHNIYTIDNGWVGFCGQPATNYHLYGSGKIRPFCEYHNPGNLIFDRRNSVEISYEEALVHEVMDQ